MWIFVGGKCSNKKNSTCLSRLSALYFLDQNALRHVDVCAAKGFQARRVL